MSKETPQNLPPSSKGQKEVWSLERLVQQAAVSKNSEMVRSVQCPCGLRFGKSILEIKYCDRRSLLCIMVPTKQDRDSNGCTQLFFLSLFEKVGHEGKQNHCSLSFCQAIILRVCVFSLFSNECLWYLLLSLHHPGDTIFLKDKGHLTRPWIKIPSWSWNPKHPEHICWGVWSLSLLTHWII